MIASLKGKTDLVTGAGRGIGQAVAVELAAAGMAVALVARSEDQLADTAQRVKHMGGAAIVVPADLAELRQVTRAVHLATDQLGAVEVLVNDAALVGPLGPVSRSTRPSGPLPSTSMPGAPPPSASRCCPPWCRAAGDASSTCPLRSRRTPGPWSA